MHDKNVEHGIMHADFLMRIYSHGNENLQIFARADFPGISS